MNKDFKIIKTVFMPGTKKGKKFMVSKNKNEYNKIKSNRNYFEI